MCIAKDQFEYLWNLSPRDSGNYNFTCGFGDNYNDVCKLCDLGNPINCVDNSQKLVKYNAYCEDCHFSRVKINAICQDSSCITCMYIGVTIY